LLPPSEFEQSFWGKFLKWAVTAGRYVTILTELVVILAFLFRFKLDTEVASLGTKIEGQKNFLESQAAREQEFRVVQKKLGIVKAAVATQIDAVEVIDEIAKIVPIGVRLDQVLVQKGQVILQAVAQTEADVNRFLLAVGAGRVWKAAELQEITTSGTGGVKFLLTIKY
jgi:Tfp pilus assembly protein PilN